jgi:hypothetical protein
MLNMKILPLDVARDKSGNRKVQVITVIYGF